MDAGRLVQGIIVIVLGALILVDGLVSYLDIEPIDLVSLPALKLMIGIIALVLAGDLLQRSQK